MNISEQIKNNKFLIFALVFALLNMGVIFYIFGLQEYGDTQDYIEVIHWFSGKENNISPERALRPLGPILAVPFEFLGDGAGLIAQNIAFYLLYAFLIFKIVDLIYHNKKQAFFASLFFVTATPVLEVGLSYLTDSGAWFFYLLSIFLTLLYFKNKNAKLIILNGFLAGIGFLMKENGGLGILFFGLMILLSNELAVKEKLFKIMRFGICFLIPVVILQLFTMKYFQITSLDWYLQHSGGLNEEGLLLTLLRYFGQLFRVMGILWIFLFIGFWKELKEKNWQKIKIFLALIPSSLSFFFWEVAGGGRTAFIFAPLGILLASYGLSVLDNKLGKKRGAFMLVLVFLAIIILNYYFSWLNPKVAFADIVAKYLGIF